MGYKSLGRSATYVRARSKFFLKGNSSVSAQYLQNFGPAGHRFLIPYALHSFVLVWLFVGVRGEPVWSRPLLSEGHVWSTSDYFYFYFLEGVPFLPSLCFVCVAGGLCGRIFVCGRQFK